MCKRFPSFLIVFDVQLGHIKRKYKGEERRERQWHFGREVPMALIFPILMQTAGGIWRMSQLSSKLDTAINQMAEFRAERYTRDEARRDRELLENKIETVRLGNVDESVASKFWNDASGKRTLTRNVSISIIDHLGIMITPP